MCLLYKWVCFLDKCPRRQCGFDKRFQNVPAGTNISSWRFQLIDVYMEVGHTSPQILPSAARCFQLLQDDARCCHRSWMLPNAASPDAVTLANVPKCCQILPDALRCSQMPPDDYRYCQILVDATDTSTNANTNANTHANTNANTNANAKLNTNTNANAKDNTNTYLRSMPLAYEVPRPVWKRTLTCPKKIVPLVQGFLAAQVQYLVKLVLQNRS